MQITTDIKADLQRSVIARSGVAVGLTWGEWKAAIAALGVRDEDVMSSIEIGVSALGIGWIGRDDDETGRIEIRERNKR